MSSLGLKTLEMRLSVVSSASCGQDPRSRAPFAPSPHARRGEGWWSRLRRAEQDYPATARIAVGPLRGSGHTYSTFSELSDQMEKGVPHPQTRVSTSPPANGAKAFRCPCGR